MEKVFFQYYPKVSYDMEKNGVTQDIVNIFRRNAVLKDLVKNETLLYDYYVKEQDTIESIAFNYYGDENYHWVIMLVNGIKDIYAEWPLNYEQFSDYIRKTYGDPDTGANGEKNADRMVHHYEDQDGDVIHRETYNEILSKPGKTNAKMISMYDFEVKKNDAKRNIKLLNKDYLKPFVDQFSTLIQKN